MSKYLKIILILYFLYNFVINIYITSKIKLYNNQNNLNKSINNLTSAYLLSTINSKTKIVENINNRILWTSIIQKNNLNLNLPGLYKYVHRNYGNHEEFFLLSKKYYLLHNLLIVN